jgi:hypothetical protein
MRQSRRTIQVFFGRAHGDDGVTEEVSIKLGVITEVLKKQPSVTSLT